MTDSTHGADDSSEQEIVLEVACNVTDTLEQAVELGEEDLLRVALLTLERVQIEESVEISLLVTDDDGLRELNREFRGRDEATDVLSFPLLDTPLVEAPADELWQPDEDDAVDAGDTGADGRGSWPSSDGQPPTQLTTPTRATKMATTRICRFTWAISPSRAMPWYVRRRRLATVSPGSAPICSRMACYI